MPDNETKKTCPEVWNTLYSFQQLGQLCDVQLQVQNGENGSLEIFLAHRLILAASSAYFQGSLRDTSQWQEVYYLDGASSESINLVLRYIYRQIDYSMLQSNSEALTTAEALQIVQHDDEETLAGISAKKTSLRSAEDESEDCYQLSTEIAKAKGLDTSEIKTVSVGCQTESGTDKMSSLSPERSKFDCGNSDKKIGTIKKKRPPLSSVPTRIRRPPASPDKPYGSDVIFAQKTVDTTGVRRSSRTPKLSQKMKEYAQVKSDLAEKSPSDAEELEENGEESAGENEMILSYKSPTVKVYTVHKKSTESSSPPETVSSQKDGNSEPANCDIASEVCGKPGEAQADLQSNGHFQCDKCPALCANQAVLDRHIQKVHGNPVKWTCEECYQDFQKQIHFINHMKQVHKKAPFECKECRLQFRAKSGYLYHIGRHHDKDALKYKCEECDKKFYLRSELTSHKIFKHSNERPFICDLCSRAFKHKKDLSRHSQTFHSDCREFKCDECDKAFKTLPDLKKHKKLHGKGTFAVSGKRFPDGMNYPCSFCSKIFTKRSQQRTHERLQHTQKDSGTSYLCTACNRSFAIKHYLMQHIKYVHMARRHQCNKCEKLFMQNHDLHRHQKKCKGKLPMRKAYVCPNCQMGFTVKGNLTKHMKVPGRCKWRRNNISDLVVLVQDSGEPQSEDVGVIAETDNDTCEDTTLVVHEIADSEEVGDCIMSVINVQDENGVEMPVVVRRSDGGEDIVDISNYPGAEFILEASAAAEGAVKTVIQVPVVQNDGTELQHEQILLTEDVIDSQSIIITNDSLTPETEIVTHPDIQ